MWQHLLQSSEFLLAQHLGAAFMTGAIVSGIISVLTKKYRKKLKKVMHLIDIVTPVLVIFERLYLVH